MMLYHGSNTAVSEPILLKAQRNLDFGKGFYTTSDLAQARSWAIRTERIRKSGSACISCYEINDEKMSQMRIMRFTKADYIWLDYVVKNRQGSLEQDDADVVIGPVANDQTFPTILLYMDGFLDAESTIKRLLPQKLKDQYAFKTERAIQLLRFQEAVLI